MPECFIRILLIRFKSGSMRLGQDALVLTKHTTSQSVGFLSQTFLKASHSDVPRQPCNV